MATENDGANDIELTVRMLDASSFKLRVNKDIDIVALKERIAVQAGVPPDQQRLIFQGRVLRDGLLSAAGVKDGHTVHLITRQAGSSGPHTSETQPQARAPSGMSSGVGGVVQGPGILMGAINLPEGQVPDIGRIVTGVLNTMGLGAPAPPPPSQQAAAGRAQASAAPPSRPPGVPSPGQMGPAIPFAVHELSQIRVMLERLTAHLDGAPAPSGPHPPPPIPMPPVMSQSELLRAVLILLEPILMRSQRLVERFSARIGSEPQMVVPAERRDTQEISRQLAPILQNLGVTLTHLAPLLHMLEMGERPGEAHVNFPAGQNIAIHIQADAGQPLPGMPPVSSTHATGVGGVAGRQATIHIVHNQPPPGLVPNQPAAHSAASQQSNGSQMRQSEQPANQQGQVSQDSHRGTGTHPPPQQMPSAQHPGVPFAPNIAGILQGVLGGQGGVQGQPNPLAGVFQMVGSLLGPLGTPPHGAASGPEASAGMNLPPNIASLFQAFAAGSPASPQAPQGPSAPPPSTGVPERSSAPQQSSIASQPLNAAFQPGNAAAEGGTGAAVHQQSYGQELRTPYSQSQNEPRGNLRPGPAQPDMGRLMSQMLPQMMQMISGAANPAANPEGGAMPSLSSMMRNIARGLNAEGIIDDGDASGPVDRLISTIMDNLAVPDMLAIAGGNLAPLERLQTPLRRFTVENLLRNDQGLQRRREAVDDIVCGLLDSVADSSLPEDVRARIVAGRDIRGVTAGVVRMHLTTLLDDVLLREPLVPSPENPLPFSSALKLWMTRMIGEWVDALAPCLRGGAADVPIVIRSVVTQLISSIGAFGDNGMTLPGQPPIPGFGMMGGMASNMIANYVLRTYQIYQQEAGTRSVAIEDWCSHLPAEDVAYWKATIAEDEAEQEHMPSQAPFSSSYQLGDSQKKRPAPTDINTLYTSVLREALQGTGAAQTVIERLSSSPRLQQLYATLVGSELSVRLNDDDDLASLSSRFPEASQLLRTSGSQRQDAHRPTAQSSAPAPLDSLELD